jgi:hypothetical protein
MLYRTRPRDADVPMYGIVRRIAIGGAATPVGA